MTYRTDYTALAWTDAKTAALYFDSVIPANIADTYRLDSEDPIYYQVLQNLLPVSLHDPSAKTGLADPVLDYVANFLVAFPQAVGVEELSTGETLQERARTNKPILLKAFVELIRQAAVDDVAVYGVKLEESSSDAQGGDPCLILSNLDLVDVGQLPWRQVIELRKDKDAIERLRNLRRVVYKDYLGKSEAFIREDIEFRLAEYQSATKLWNLPTQKGLLEIAMTGEALTAVGAAVALTLFGAPIAAAAAAGGAIAIGKVALSLAQRKREIEIERRKNPMAYLADLKRLASK